MQATINISSVADAIRLLADEAERQGSDANDSSGIVRALVGVNLPGRVDAQFSAWFCVCCELADRAARVNGYTSAVEQAWAKSHAPSVASV